MSDAKPEAVPVGGADRSADAGRDPAPGRGFGRDPERDPAGAEAPAAEPAAHPETAPVPAPEAVPYGGAGPETDGEPLGVPREPTGYAAVDAHLERLAEVDRLPADRHPAVYEDVHRGLRAELTSLDAHPAPRPHDNRS
ncbi:hypothetical protein [Streptomyces sp.]|uniref:hypothetical protein n=1 Tax=Streptomyces sp. TaxID=1931 RepID=UPI0028115F9D|nr:hypothetical protein [Streptomyces sp.]